MLNYEFPPIGGGAGQAHLNLLKEFAKHPDLHIDVLTSRPQPEFAMEEFASNIRLHKIGLHKKNLHYWKKSEILEWLFKAKRYYRRLVQDHSYDLVHSFFAFPSGWLCLQTAGRIPYIVSLRGSDVPGFNTRLKLDYVLLKGLFNRIWRKADAVVANSAGLAQLAKQFDASLTYDVIPNGIDTDMFSPPRERLLKGPLKLLTVCRLIARKRIHLLIEALAILIRDGIDARLTIAGEGNLLDELRHLTGRLGLLDRVCFSGLVTYDKMAALYREHDLFVMSSQHEGMSNAMLEAMACGLPVVTTACEGSEELIDGTNGFVVNHGDAQLLTQAIRQVHETPGSYAKMAQAARQKALKLSWATAADHYIELYHKTLS